MIIIISLGNNNNKITVKIRRKTKSIIVKLPQEKKLIS